MREGVEDDVVQRVRFVEPRVKAVEGESHGQMTYLIK
jgi:hypothetical protein